MQATVLSVTPPGQPAPSVPVMAGHAAQGQIVRGEIIGQQRGFPLLAVGNGLLSLSTPPLPPQTQVALLLTPVAPAAVRPAAAEFPVYPSLPPLMEAAQAAGGTAAAAVAAALPKLGPKLAAELMIMTSALTKGDIRTIIGDQARRDFEKAGKSKAVADFGRDVSEGSREASRSAAGDWRAITLPLQTGTMVEPVKLWLHNSPEVEEDGQRRNGGGDTRFMIDLTLSRLGPMQVDGLARPGKLDLVIRTPSPLPPDIRRGLNAAFAGTASANGIAGGLSFHVSPPLKPVQQPLPVRPGVVA
jgi:hypothetical protein